MCDCSQAPTGSLQKLDTTARCDITADGWMQQLVVDIIRYSIVHFSMHFLPVELFSSALVLESRTKNRQTTQF
jgi:hypothetical protein